MDIVILGAGKTGSYVAAALSKEEHNAILIDKDPKALEKIERESDIATLLVPSHSWKFLEEVIENKPHLFFAATGDDETNLVACCLAKNLGVPKTMARLHSREYLDASKLDLSRLFFTDYFLAPEVLAAQDLLKTLIYNADLAVEHFAHGAIQMRTIQVPDLWDRGGLPICKLNLPEDLIAGLIRRKNSEGETILIPHGEDHILPGDQVTLVGQTKAMLQLHTLFQTPQHPLRSVVLVGGSLTAIHLGELLCQQKVHVRIIEKDSNRCEELAEKLPSATIIHRDGRDPELFHSENIQNVDALISCTHTDETNLLIASLAKQCGCPKTIAQITESNLVPLLEKLGVQPALSPRIHIANRILSILDEETTLSMASLSSDAAKIVELKVSSSSKLVGIPLSDLNLPKGLLIAVIESRGKVSIGRGHQILYPEDIVIAICHPIQVPKLQQMFH